MRANSIKNLILLGALAVAQLPGSAVSAQTGEDHPVQTLRITSSGQYYEPMQNLTPYSPPRPVGSFEATITWRPSDHTARIERRLVSLYPFPGDRSYSIIYSGPSGYISGNDGFRPNPPGAIAPARIGAEAKILWLSNPWAVEWRTSAAIESEIGENHAGQNKRHLLALETIWVMESDPDTGHARYISTMELDPLEGEIENRITFDDWRDVDGTPFPFRLEQYVGDQLVAREIRHSIEVNPELADDVFVMPEASAPDSPGAETGWNMSQFFTRRAGIGAPADRDLSLPIEFLEVGDGIYQIIGVGHNNLLVEGPNSLALVDAVWYPKRSTNILAALAERWPGKPLKYLVLTHHHADHSGGIRPFAEAGATIVVQSLNQPYFQDLLTRTTPGPISMLTIDRRAELPGFGRQVDAFEILTTHAAGMLGVWVPDAKLVYDTDLFSPGLPSQHPVWSTEFFQSLEFHQIDAEYFVGGHGQGALSHEEMDN